MPIGPGKYDKQAVEILESSGAGLVMIAVMGGREASGLSIAGDPLLIGLVAPDVLRQIAYTIEKDMSSKPN